MNIVAGRDGRNGRVRLRRPWAAAVGLVALGATSLALTGSATAGGSEAIGYQVPKKQLTRSDGFWTPERVERAIANGSPLERQEPAGGDALRPLDRTYPRHSPVPPEWGNPAVGKILFRFLGRLGSCTGTVIDTASKRLVLTAAHCLFLGRWSNFVKFIPAYEEGSRPYGTWSPRTFWVPRTWYYSSNPNFDTGVLVFRKRIGDTTGSVAYETYPERRGTSRIFGYPAGAMRGQRQRVCESGTWPGDILSFRLPGPHGMVARCDMAAGSSGGPWISRYTNEQDPNNPYWILDGLTSRGGGGKLTSPYLGRRLVLLIRQAEGR